MAEKANITLSISKSVKQKLKMVAEEERRSINNLVEIILVEWLAIHEELHPQFVADIKASLAEVGQGKVEPYARG